MKEIKETNRYNNPAILAFKWQVQIVFHIHIHNAFSSDCG